ncbi:hypothetical protein ASPZODRAFT_674986 [Penicilliopsis zonata CBS 506.65]|uniref:Zn(2)-C6 fungal-type domain-containing protein n=1 Tax=Penicilliopsis zonata CBS 506.65 TaxID=1073090 RepID=A0A1L9SDA9_9EURO|nr:hypothetical protein ASPZODRAFT_674986 [Penicilliopsis zonata CBS 506.65]OJJ45077.1 hypothetical protein ASPZODRAFT_674986 [Penicilliopsis zonata CBS 506.65]
MSTAFSLRRSCQGCAKSKRRCDMAAPTCSRCAAKGLTCEYVNAPLVGGKVSSSAAAVVGSSQIRPPLRLEIIKTHNHAIIRFLVGEFRDFPLIFSQHMKTHFIHPTLYEGGLPPPIRSIHAVCKLHQDGRLPAGVVLFDLLRRTSTEIHRQTKHAANFNELLACVQALILAQCALIFDDNVSSDESSEYAETTNERLVSLARQLWAQAPVQLSSTLSPYRAWVYAESVRRTIITCFVLSNVYSLRRRQYGLRTPFVDALPFDLRTALWDAPCADSWLAASAGLLPQASTMVSLHEYTGLLLAGRVHGPSPFGGLILAACKGVSLSQVPHPPVRDYFL